MAAEIAIETNDLQKSYGDVRALAGIDIQAPTGTVLGLLGPNGAGKTTAVRILTTLLAPDGGTARVVGLDAVRDAAALRARIGLAGQYAAVDENLTGQENLEIRAAHHPVPGRGRPPRGSHRGDRPGTRDRRGLLVGFSFSAGVASVVAGSA